jgi:serine/threonine-protein kinase
MKNSSKKYLVIPLVLVLSIITILIILDNFVLPYVVKADENKVPNVVGMHKDQAIQTLKDLNLNPIVQTARYDEKFRRDHVIFQKPNANTVVKENRRVYLTVSGGVQIVTMPFLINKTIRDAMITMDRVGLVISEIEEVESELPTNTIIEQQFLEGKELPKGTHVKVKVSIGPRAGMVRVPNLLGKSLAEAENLLRSYSLRIGIKSYIVSINLLPNTIVDQQPSESSLVSVGDSINVVLTHSGR